MDFLSEYQDLNEMKKYKNHIKSVIKKHSKLEKTRKNFADSLKELVHFECVLPVELNLKQKQQETPIYPLFPIAPYMMNPNLNSRPTSISATQLGQHDLQEIKNLMEFINRLKSKVTIINPTKPQEVDLQLNDITANLQEFSSTLDQNINQIKNIGK